jgi:hypothetical protein
MKSVNLVYFKNGNGNWVVDRVYALNHTARARASTLRTKEGRESFIVQRTVRQSRGKKNA